MKDNWASLMSIIVSEDRQSIFVYHNVRCTKCHHIYLEMRRVGALIFCKKCCDEEFSTLDPVKEERERYKYWLDITYNEITNWGEEYE